MIKFSCPECGYSIRVPDEAAGKRGKCKQCGAAARVPQPRKAAELITSPPPLDFDEPALPSRHRRGSRPRREVSPVHVEIHQEKQPSNSLGIAALVLGVIALLFACVPFINFFTALPLGLLGLLLSGIGLFMAITRKGTGIGYPIAAGAVNLIAAGVPLIMLAFFGAAAESVSQEMERNNRPLTNNATGEDTSGGSVASDASPWANAGPAYTGSLVSVQITGAKIGKVPLKDFTSEGTSKDDLLMFTVEATNKQEAKKLNFTGWKGSEFSGANAATLEDEHGNIYKRIGFGFGTEVVGQADNDSIYPQKSVTDVLVFEVPVDAAKQLRLKLPASAYGEQGMVHLVYDATQVER